MYNLIVKDLILMKKMLLMSFGFAIFISLLGNPPTFSMCLIGLFLVTGTGHFEDRNQSHIMLNSLPLSRKQIISSKYVGVLVSALYATILSISAQFLFTLFIPQTFTDFRQILAGIMIILMMGAFYYPILYKFGVKYVRMIIFSIFVFVIFLGRIVLYIFRDQVETIKQFFMQFTVDQLVLTFLFATVVTFMISWILSIKIYEAKEF